MPGTCDLPWRSCSTVCLVSRVEAFAGIALAALVVGQPGVPSRDRVLLDPRITESSDLVASARHPGLLWTTNDSGGSGRVFGVDRSGKAVAVLHLRGLTPATGRRWRRGARSTERRSSGS